jgi:hypothetical protein
MADTQQFEPLNPLESRLLQAQRGRSTTREFMETLMESKVTVLLDKELGPSGQWDNSATPLVLSNAAGNPVLAMFTAPERATPWHNRVPGYEFGLVTDFRWLLRGIGEDVGVVINPGHPVGMELIPEGVAKLKARL